MGFKLLPAIPARCYKPPSTTAPTGFPMTILDYACDQTGVEISIP
jgi:hypothetical protein